MTTSLKIHGLIAPRGMNCGNGMSMIENLTNIKINGLEGFLISETEKWKCENCGAGLCVHRDFCLKCNTKINKTHVNKP